MAFEAILDEVDQLHNVSTRLEGLAEQHPPVSEALVTIAGNVRNAIAPKNGQQYGCQVLANEQTLWR